MYFGSHSAIAPFNLYQPGSAREAASLFQETDGNFLGGGVDLIPAMRGGMPVKDIIALTNVNDLGQLDQNDEYITLGSGLTWAQLQRATLMRDHFPELVSLLDGVANVRIRAAATLGGNIAARNPAYDALPLLHAAGARLMIDSGNGPQATGKHSGFADDLPPGLIHSIQIPLRGDHRLLIDRSRKPVAAVYIGLWRDASSVDSSLHGTLAIGCAYPRFISVPLLLDGLKNMRDVAGNASEISAALASELPEPQTDRHASSGYRKRLIPIQARRLLQNMAGDK